MPKGYWMLPGERPPKQKAFAGDCDEIRQDIAAFLATKAMTKAEFLRQCGAAIGKEVINSGSYAQFMSRKGPCAGEDYGLYGAATAFFASRRATTTGIDTGIAMPVAGSAGSATLASTVAVVSRPTKAEAAATFAAVCAELEDIEIPGEDIEDDAYDKMSCSVVRRRLNEYIVAQGITQSAMLAHLDINSNSWGKFMAFTGAYQGSGSSVYSKSLRFFTKLRILKQQQGKREAKLKPKPPKQVSSAASVPILVVAQRRATLGVTSVTSSATAAGVSDTLAGKRSRDESSAPSVSVIQVAVAATPPVRPPQLEETLGSKIDASAPLPPTVPAALPSTRPAAVAGVLPVTQPRAVVPVTKPTSDNGAKLGPKAAPTSSAKKTQTSTLDSWLQRSPTSK